MAKHIVIVDDDEAILEAVKILLQEYGYQVTALSNAAEVQSQVPLLQPDLILLDLLMSGVDGRDVVRQLKADSRTQQIPIVLMSADTYIKEKSHEVDVADYIKKPFDIEELETVIGKYCR